MIDETPVPHRLEDAIAEAEDQHILDGFFAEVVIDAIDLALAQHAADLGVQRFCTRQVVAKRFFVNKATEAVLFAGQAGTAELASDLAKEARTGSEIEEGIAARLVLVAHLVEQA